MFSCGQLNTIRDLERTRINSLLYYLIIEYHSTRQPADPFLDDKTSTLELKRAISSEKDLLPGYLSLSEGGSQYSPTLTPSSASQDLLLLHKPHKSSQILTRVLFKSVLEIHTDSLKRSGGWVSIENKRCPGMLCKPTAPRNVHPSRSHHLK